MDIEDFKGRVLGVEIRVVNVRGSEEWSSGHYGIGVSGSKMSGLIKIGVMEETGIRMCSELHDVNTLWRS
eukprot:scaffold1869_cov122-Cylindrotheca_fusiformis.AAC.58